MSTKTLRKRIALVAVSAMAFGLLSAAPSSAAGGNYVVSASTGSATVAVGTQFSASVSVLVASDTPANTNKIVVTPSVAVPNNATAATIAAAVASTGEPTPTVGTAFLKASAQSAAMTTAGLTVSTATTTVVLTSDGTAAGLASTKIGTIYYTPASVGTHTITLTGTDVGFGDATNQTITITAVDPTVSSVVYRAASVREDLSHVALMTSAASVGSGKLQFISGPSDQTNAQLTSGAYFTSASSTTIIGAAVGTASTSFKFNGGATGITDGAYVFRAFDDVDASGTYNAGDLGSTLLTVTAATGYAGAASLTLQKPTIDVAAAGTATTLYTYSVTDADGNPSYLAGAEAMTGSVTATGSTTSVVGTGALQYFEFVDGGDGTGYISITKDSANAVVPSGTYTVGITGSGALATYGSTATLTVVKNIGYVTGMTATSNANLVFDTTNNGVANSTLSAATISAAKAATSITFSFTGGNYVAGSAVRVPVTIATSVGTSVSAIVAPALVSVNPDGTGTFSVTNAAPTSGDSYTVKVPTNAAQNTFVGFTVTYASGNPIFRAVNVAPAAAFTVKTGTSNTVSAVLDNGFGVAQASKIVTVSVTGRNPVTTQVTTDATGKISYTVADVPAVATATTDTVTFTHAYITSTGAAATATTTFTITYNATGVVVGNVLVTAANATRTVDTVEQFAGQPAATSKNVYTATVSDSTGLPLAAGNVVTFSGGTDDIFLNGVKTAVTDASGQASVTVYRKKISYATITATIAGVSGSLNTVKWSTTAYANGNTDVFRNVGLVLTGNAESGGIIRATATVTDRWGNAVSAVPLTLQITGAGRLYTGEVASGATVVTNSLGQFQWNITSAATETGTTSVTVAMSGGQSLDLANYITVPGGSTSVLVTGVTAGNKDKTVSAMFTSAASGVTNADVLKSIVALIASINKQIQALQKLILKR